MYFDAGLKVENRIYLIERFSRCLISIHISSGETKIEAYLPWKYTENKIGMLSWNRNIFIYSPVMDHVLVYDSVKQQIRSVKLQGIEADEMGIYYSNVLIIQDDFVVLPFKGKEIKRYGMNGELKFKDSQWRAAIAKECHCDKKEFGNIRVNSACIAGNQIFFSLIYGNQNYLYRYELKQDERLSSIVYDSGDKAIRGVYTYPNMVLFRRIFPDKTELVLISLDSDEQKTIMIDYPSMFEEDVYGDIRHLRVALKNQIMAIEGNELNELNVQQKIYDLKYSDVYIANGILFNAVRNEILTPDVDCTPQYSIDKMVREIKNSSSYQEGCRKLFDGKCICEGRYKLHDLTNYLNKFPPLMIEKKSFMKDKSIGEQIWRTIQ